MNNNFRATDFTYFLLKFHPPLTGNVWHNMPVLASGVMSPNIVTRPRICGFRQGSITADGRGWTRINKQNKDLSRSKWARVSRIKISYTIYQNIPVHLDNEDLNAKMLRTQRLAKDTLCGSLRTQRLCVEVPASLYRNVFPIGIKSIIPAFLWSSPASAPIRVHPR